MATPPGPAPRPSSGIRYPLIDLMRVAAIGLMVFFHLFYDLDQWGFVDIDFRQDVFWFWLPKLIVWLFMLCVGMGLAMTHSRGVVWKKVGKRLAQLGGAALGVSLFTYFAFPKNWVYFGTLHCIALSSILALPFLRRPNWALALGLAMITLYWGLDLRLPSLSKYLGIVAMDYIPPHPWLGVVLMGIFFHSRGLQHWQAHWRLPGPVTWVSRHSLSIYLLHQVVLYGLVFFAHKLWAKN